MIETTSEPVIRNKPHPQSVPVRSNQKQTRNNPMRHLQQSCTSPDLSDQVQPQRFLLHTGNRFGLAKQLRPPCSTDAGLHSHEDHYQRDSQLWRYHPAPRSCTQSSRARHLTILELAKRPRAIPPSRLLCTCDRCSRVSRRPTDCSDDLGIRSIPPRGSERVDLVTWV